MHLCGKPGRQGPISAFNTPLAPVPDNDSLLMGSLDERKGYSRKIKSQNNELNIEPSRTLSTITYILKQHRGTLGINYFLNRPIIHHFMLI